MRSLRARKAATAPPNTTKISRETSIHMVRGKPRPEAPTAGSSLIPTASFPVAVGRAESSDCVRFRVDDELEVAFTLALTGRCERAAGEDARPAAQRIRAAGASRPGQEQERPIGKAAGWYGCA